MKIYHILIMLTLICTIPVVSAESLSDIKAKKVHVTPEYVEADGVCSCSLMDDRYHHHAFFANYCPACGSNGTLLFEEGPNSYTCPEGMWYCSNCDADFCLIHGKEHVEGTSLWLKPYHKPQNTTKFQVQNKINVMKEQWISLQNQNIISV